MDESFSGFTTRGSWVAIVEHGERITRALRDEGVPEERLERFAEWRPKAHERLREDVEEKTAEQGLTPEIDAETGERSPDVNQRADDSETATPPDESSTPEESVSGDSTPEASEDDERLQKSVEQTARAADSTGRKALRAAERAVYRTVMRKTAPYYFNAALLSASIQRTREGDAPYVFEVTIKDQDLKQRVSTRLATYDEEVERWHVDTEKDTENAEAAEGAEPTEEESESDPESDIAADFTTT